MRSRVGSPGLPSIALAVAALTLSACRTARARRPPEEEHIATEATSATTPQRRATVLVRYQPPLTTARSFVRAVLRLTGGAAAAVTEIELDLVEAHGAECADWDCAALRAAFDRPYVLRFAPDAHALGVSLDGGAHYRYIGLDVPGTPLYCTHRSFQLEPGADAWRSAPTTGTLATEVLTSDDAAGPHVDTHYGDELSAAVEYACSAGVDPAVRRSVAQGVVMHRRRARSQDELNRWVLCARNVAREDAEARNALIRQLGSEDNAELAATMLADAAEPEVQDAAAQLLNTLIDSAHTPDMSNATQHRALFAWLLARTTRTRHAVTPTGLDALIRTARLRDTPATNAAIVYALSGLVVIRDRAALFVLERWARQPCDSPLGAESGLSYEWPASYARAQTLPPECLLRALH